MKSHDIVKAEALIGFEKEVEKTDTIFFIELFTTLRCLFTERMFDKNIISKQRGDESVLHK